MPIINIPGRGTQTISINGKLRDIPRGSDTSVSADELGVLRDSIIAFVVIDEKKGDAPNSGADTHPVQVPGGDALTASEPTPSAVVIPPADVDQTPGGDALTPSHPSEITDDGREAKAIEDARAASADADAGTTPPVAILTNVDPDQTGDAGDSFDANAVLNGSVGDVSAHLDDFSPDQIADLIVAEKKGKARATLLAALEARKG